MTVDIVITDGLITVGVVREGSDGFWHAYNVADRLICTAATRHAATEELLKVVRLAHAGAV